MPDMNFSLMSLLFYPFKWTENLLDNQGTWMWICPLHGDIFSNLPLAGISKRRDILGFEIYTVRVETIQRGFCSMERARDGM